MQIDGAEGRSAGSDTSQPATTMWTSYDPAASTRGRSGSRRRDDECEEVDLICCATTMAAGSIGTGT